MIKINIICIGSLKEKYHKLEQNEYLKRLSKYSKIEVVEISDSKITSFENPILIDKTLNEEAVNIFKRIKTSDYVFLIDLHGQELSSEEFASSINTAINNGSSTLDFIIGGTLGLGEELRRRSQNKICLSKMTFPHQFTRIIVLEQIYRAFKIINNESYHH